MKLPRFNHPNINPKNLLSGVIALGLLLVSFILLIFLPTLVEGTSNEVALTMTIIVGVIAMMASLTLASFVLNCLGLSNNEEALGLPTGSVRAIIALSLILIFAIMSIFMFQSLAYPVRTEEIVIFSNSTTIDDQIITNTTRTIGGNPQALADFSKQTLTTVGTLVVAIAAFYFGTRSVQVAKGSTEKAELFIDPSDTKNWIKDQDNPIIILVKPTPEDAAINYTIDGDEYKSVQRETPNRLIYSPTAPTKEVVTLTFNMPAYSDIAAKELRVKIVKPSLSIDPSTGKEIAKDETVSVKAIPAPIDADVECTITGDDYKSVKQDPKNSFIYKPKIEEGEVALSFKMPKYPAVEARELKVKIVKPSLSIEPSANQEIAKNASLSIEAKPAPKDAKVECTLTGDDKGSVKGDPVNKFTYKSAIDEGKEATLTFKMSAYPTVAAKELKVKIAKK